MAYTDTVAYLTQGSRLFIDGKEWRNMRSAGGIGGGTKSKIDITTTASTSTEYALGLPEQGSMDVQGTLAFQHPLVKTIETMRDNGSYASCELYVGVPPSGDNVTDGSGHVVEADVGVTASIVSSKRTYTTDKDANLFQAISEGDLIKDGSDYNTIEKLAKVNNKLVITTDATTTSSSDEVDIVRPAIKLSFVAGIDTFSKSMTTNGVWEYSLNLAISGAVSYTIGNPDVTIS